MGREVMSSLSSWILVKSGLENDNGRKKCYAFPVNCLKNSNTHPTKVEKSPNVWKSTCVITCQMFKRNTDLFSKLKLLTSLFQMVLLDVLIIGGGPHALTLASLLSGTEPNANCERGHDFATCGTCSSPLLTLEQTGSKCTNHKKKTKKRRPTAGKAECLERWDFIG